MVDFPLVLVLLVYLVLSKIVLEAFPPTLRQASFTALNILAIALVFRWGEAFSFLILYMILVLFEYFFIVRVNQSVFSYRLAIFFPILILFLFKYIPERTETVLKGAGFVLNAELSIYFVGLSYMAFRLSQLAVEIRAQGVPRPNLWNYLSFSFFLPTFPIGPISTYRTFSGSFDQLGSYQTPWGTSIARILVGATKFYFLANLFNQLSFEGFILDQNPHPLIDLFIAGFCYYMFLYLNFSGFCDMAIGAAGILGIKVEENFNNPILSRNLQDFWNRWHITLGAYMRQMVFNPLSKALVMRLGRSHTNLCVGASIFVVFVLIGIWHGRGMQFVLFGLIHAIGVLLVFLYTHWIKKTLGRDYYRAYLNNRVITNISRVVTFSYVSVSMVVFANSPSEIFYMLQEIVL